MQKEIDDYYQPALRALGECVKATVTKRVNLKCPKCSHAFRQQVSLPNPRERLAAARFIAEQKLGRAAPQQAEREEDDTIIFKRLIVPVETGEIIDRLVEVGLLSDSKAALFAIATVEREYTNSGGWTQPGTVD